MVKVAIVAAYNSQVEMTREFLDTMRKTIPFYYEVQLVLVNGGCPTIIEDPIISTYIHLDRNEGFCKVLNAGLRAVEECNYVFFVGNDSFPVDDQWLPRLIELQQRTGAWMVCPANDRPGMENYSSLYKKDCGEYWEVDFFPSIAWLMPYDKFKRIGLLDERFVRTGMYADNDYCRRIRNEGGLIVVSKNILLRHLLSGEGRVLGTQGEDMATNGRAYREKYPGAAI